MIKPTREQFEEWRSHPVTEWVMDRFLAAEMRRTRGAFDERAWAGGVDAADHRVYRERHDTLDWVRGLDMATIEDSLKEQE
jgi:hypothetical protein